MKYSFNNLTINNIKNILKDSIIKCILSNKKYFYEDLIHAITVAETEMHKFIFMIIGTSSK